MIHNSIPPLNEPAAQSITLSGGSFISGSADIILIKMTNYAQKTDQLRNL